MARASCRLTGDVADESSCLYGVVREIVNSDAAPDRGGRFCAGVDKQFKTRCYSGVGSVMSALETGDTLRATCKRVSGRHVQACLEGAGLALGQS